MRNHAVDCGPFGIVSAPIVVSFDANGNVVRSDRRCDACGMADSVADQTFEYVDGSFFHDGCAEELQIPESDMVVIGHARRFADDI
jgi:ferredoxin